MPKKRSFFDRFSGTVSTGDEFDSFDEELESAATIPERGQPRTVKPEPASRPIPLEEEAPKAATEGQLPVDLYQTSDDIIVHAFVAGVRADELNISISRDMVEIEGSRTERDQVSGPDYFTRELFWGSFSRTILLPQEVDVENAAAQAKDGLLTIKLPKLDKAKQTKLKVKAG